MNEAPIEENAEPEADVLCEVRIYHPVNGYITVQMDWAHARDLLLRWPIIEPGETGA